MWRNGRLRSHARLIRREVSAGGELFVFLHAPRGKICASGIHDLIGARLIGEESTFLIFYGLPGHWCWPNAARRAGPACIAGMMVRPYAPPGAMSQNTITPAEPAAAAPADGQGNWREVLAVFLRLGLTSFGGLVAHLGYFREEFVNRRHWLDDRSYADLVALCQFLPGPASSQVGIAVGLLRAGYGGALAAWTGFTLPSALAMVLFAYGVGSPRQCGRVGLAARAQGRGRRRGGAGGAADGAHAGCPIGRGPRSRSRPPVVTLAGRRPGPDRRILLGGVTAHAAGVAAGQGDHTLAGSGEPHHRRRLAGRCSRHC